MLFCDSFGVLYGYCFLGSKLFWISRFYHLFYTLHIFFEKGPILYVTLHWYDLLFFNLKSSRRRDMLFICLLI